MSHTPQRGHSKHEFIYSKQNCGRYQVYAHLSEIASTTDCNTMRSRTTGTSNFVKLYLTIRVSSSLYTHLFLWKGGCNNIDAHWLARKCAAAVVVPALWMYTAGLYALTPPPPRPAPPPACQPGGTAVQLPYVRKTTPTTKKVRLHCYTTRQYEAQQ